MEAFVHEEESMRADSCQSVTLIEHLIWWFMRLRIAIQLNLEMHMACGSTRSMKSQQVRVNTRRYIYPRSSLKTKHLLVRAVGAVAPPRCISQLESQKPRSSYGNAVYSYSLVNYWKILGCSFESILQKRRRAA